MEVRAAPRRITPLADAHEELAADNAAAAIREHRIDLALVDEPPATPAHQDAREILDMLHTTLEAAERLERTLERLANA